MKAVVFPEPGRFVVQEVPEPQVQPGQVLVRVLASMICATDMKVFTGRFAGVRYPHIPGHEWAGRVVAVGPGVDEVKVGDRVGIEVHVGCGRCQRCMEGLYNLCERYGQADHGHAHIGFTVPGGLAEYCAVPVRAVHRVPDSVSDEEAAFTDNIGVALWAVERARIQPGERVLVVGPGAIGLLALQLVRASGAGRVVLAGTRPDRLLLGEELGADAVVNVSEAADAVAAVRQAFGGAAPDAVVEFAGTGPAAELSLKSVRRGGRVVLGGSTGLGTTLNIDLSVIVRGHLEVYGSVANPRWVSARGLRLLERGVVQVKPLISHRFALHEFERAWTTYFDRSSGAVRVLLVP